MMNPSPFLTTVRWYKNASRVNNSSLFWWAKHLEGFWEKLHICVSIFLVHYLEDSTDSVSNNLSEIKDYYLHLHPVFTSFKLDSTLATLRKTERLKRNWQVGQYLTTNKSSTRTSSNYCICEQCKDRVEGRRLVECQIMWKKKLLLLHDLQCRPTPIFYVCTELLQRLTFLYPVSSKQQSQFTINTLSFVCS